MMLHQFSYTTWSWVRYVLPRHYSTSKSEKIYQYLQKALDNYEDVGFMPLRVKNFILEKNFSNAPIDVFQYLRDLDGNIREPHTVNMHDFERGRVRTHLIPFKSLFGNGFDALYRKMERRDIEYPLLSFATEAFVTGFLYEKDYHESCLQAVLQLENEGHISVVMANHLFSRLTANTGRNYFVTNDTTNKLRLIECPCSRNCGEEILFDTTGIGSELLWYGRPDIMIFPLGSVSCIVVPQELDDEDDNLMTEFNAENHKQMIEVKGNTSALRIERNVQRIVSIAITLSMYQKISQMKQDQSPFVSLVPIIAAGARNFDIYLYDSIHDVLLRNMGPPISLWEDEIVRKHPAKLNLSSVLKLWMIINHLSVQPLISREDVKLLSGSCGFLSRFTNHEQLEEIEATLRMARSFHPVKNKEFEAHFFTLSTSQGIWEQEIWDGSSSFLEGGTSQKKLNDDSD